MAAPTWVGAAGRAVNADLGGRHEISESMRNHLRRFYQSALLKATGQAGSKPFFPGLRLGNVPTTGFTAALTQRLLRGRCRAFLRRPDPGLPGRRPASADLTLVRPEGREPPPPAAIRPIDSSEPVQDHEGPARACTASARRSARMAGPQWPRLCSGTRWRLRYRTRAEPSAGVTTPPVGQDQQGLAHPQSAATGNSRSPPVQRQSIGEMPQVCAGQLDRRRADEHARPLVSTGDLRRDLSYQELRRSAEPDDPHAARTGRS